LLSRAGVEWAAVWAVAGLRLMNLAQALVSLYFVRHPSVRPLLGVAAVAVLAVSGGIVVSRGLRARHLIGWTIAVDLAAGIAVLLAAPLFQPSGSEPWMDWPIAITFLIGAEAAVCFRPAVAALGIGMLLAGSLTWLARGAPAETESLVYRSAVAYVGFGAVTAVFLLYLRKLATLADTRGDLIRELEEERTRRVLHTPYRLLHELAARLRSESGDGSDARRRAQLAEAIASVHEIESIVRGTEPASANLAAELRRLQEQFVDLPLMVCVDDVASDLATGTVYRIREAVRSALQNVRLHADAGEVVVYACTGRSSWLVSVHDDGRGFDPAGRRGTGIDELIVGSMREIGADARIESSPGDGTFIEITGGQS
jgi:signal transduction histidine kinase